MIGVDNDALLRDLSSPPLSRVIPNTQRTGYEAAELLDRMMSGRTVDVAAHLISPVGIATRQSTDTLAIEDRAIARAVLHIREHAFEQINIASVLEVVPLSRRLFESRFKNLLGHTPHEEIIRVRMKSGEGDVDRNRSSAGGHCRTHWIRTCRIPQRHFQNKRDGVSPNRYRTQNKKQDQNNCGTASAISWPVSNWVDVQ